MIPVGDPGKVNLLPYSFHSYGFNFSDFLIQASLIRHSEKLKSRSKLQE